MRHLPDEIRDLAAELLTPAQHEAWTLETRGITQRGISWHLDISRSAVLDRLDAAHRKLRKAGVRQDLATGNYYLEYQPDLPTMDGANGQILEPPTPPASSNGRSQHPPSSTP